MANNLAVTPGTGATIALEEISSVKYQQIKLIDATAASVNPTGVPTNPLSVLPIPSVVGGWTPSIKAALSNTNSQVKSGAGVLGGWHIYNPDAAVAYVQIFDTATGSITVGTTVPKLSIGVPPEDSIDMDSEHGIIFNTAICVAATSDALGASAPGTPLDCNFWYK